MAKSKNKLYSKLPNLVLGFHGCSLDTYTKVIKEGKPLQAGTSKNDWLGRGLYFWENNLSRAWSWAAQTFKNKEHTAVIGAVLDLGNCLNLSDETSIDILKDAYQIYKKLMEMEGKALPKNKDIEVEGDKLYRPLDFAVMECLHIQRQMANEQAFDSIRGTFLIEGEPIYPSAGIREKSHVQICIRNPNCIKGYFTPLEENANFIIP